jgi:ferric-dicitrate binding protein FerR (iron transport regulator)
MSGDDFDLLVARWLSGEASEADETEMARELRTSEASRLRFVELSDQEAALRILSQSQVQAREIRTEYGLEDTPRRLPRIRRRFPLSGSTAGRGVAALAAASLLFAIIVVAALSSPKPAPRSIVTRRPALPAPEPEVPPRLAERLQELGRERERLTKPDPVPAPDPNAEEKRREALAQNDEERRAIEDEIRRSVAEARAKTPTPEPAPERTPEKNVTKTAPTAIARLDRVAGEVYVLTESGRTAAAAGQELLLGQGLEAVGAASAAAFTYGDKTRVEASGDTELREIGKRVRVVRGAIRSDISKQPVDQPMLFVSAHGEARVLGTSLRLVVDPASTRLEVQEGKVRLKRLSDGKSVDVGAGQFAVAGPGAEPAARPMPIDEILLLPAQARRIGTEWRLVKDDKAAAGEALEWKATETQSTPKDPAGDLKLWNREYLEFRFTADAGRDYTVWVRGASVADRDPLWYDQMAIELPTGQGSGMPWPEATGVTAYMFNGHAVRPGYWWIGGDADGIAGGSPRDAMPLTVRFSRPGLQTVRLRAFHRPIMIRVDAIWLSTTQKARPEDRLLGPDVPRK